MSRTEHKKEGTVPSGKTAPSHYLASVDRLDLIRFDANAPAESIQLLLIPRQLIFLEFPCVAVDKAHRHLSGADAPPYSGLLEGWVIGYLWRVVFAK